jgi:ribose transport system permease protein
LAGLSLLFSLTTENFFTRTTFHTLANQIPTVLIVAVGMTFVLIVGGIDLSVGSVLALSGAVLGIGLVRLLLPLPIAILLCVTTGLVCGAINGLIVIKWKIPSFIVTLGMLEVARGGTYLVSGSRTQYLGLSIDSISGVKLLEISLPFALALILVLAAQTVLWRTRFGRYVFATGANEEVLRLSGVDPRPVKLAVFMLSGMLTAVASVIYCSRLSAADPNAGNGFELQAIAATVVGGNSLQGGRGSAIGTFFGVLIIAVLGIGLAQIGAQEPTKRLFTGSVIVIAVIIDQYKQSRVEARKR